MPLSASPHGGSLCLTSLWLSVCLTSWWLSASPHCGSLPHLTVALCLPHLTVALPHFSVALCLTSLWLSASPHCGSLFASPHCGSLFASPHCSSLRLFASPHCGSLCLTSLCSLCLTSLWLSLPHLTVALSASPHCGSLLASPHCGSLRLFASPHCGSLCLTSLWLSLPHPTVALCLTSLWLSASPDRDCLTSLWLCVSVCITSLWLSLYHLTVAMFALPHCGSLSVCLTWQWLYLCLTWRWLPSSPDSGSLFCLTLLWLSLFASLHNGSLLLCVWCWSCSLSTSKCTHHTAQDVSPGCPSEHELLTQLLASVLMPSSPPPLLISLSFHSCTLPVALFVPVLVPASSNFQYLIYKCKLKGDVLSYTLVLLSGTNFLCMLEINAATISTFKSTLKTYLFILQEWFASWLSPVSGVTKWWAWVNLFLSIFVLWRKTLCNFCALLSLPIYVLRYLNIRVWISEIAIIIIINDVWLSPLVSNFWWWWSCL